MKPQTTTTTQTSETPVTNPPANPTAAGTKPGFSLARLIMLAALVIHLYSLHLLYQDTDSQYGGTVLWNTGAFVDVSKEIPEQTGNQLFPYAAYFIVALIFIFISGFYNRPFWQRWGYWVSLVLLFMFAFGGAVVRTGGGRLSLLAMSMVLLAAVINTFGRKKPAA